MIESLTVRGLLSYGWEPTTLPLRGLNLVIGPNGSGKTNLLDTLDLLSAASLDPRVPLRNKGGAAAWIHALPGGDGQGFVEVVVSDRQPGASLRYRLTLHFADGEVREIGESLDARDQKGTGALFLRASAGTARVKVTDPQSGRTRWQNAQVTGTALAQLRGNPLCPEISHVASELANIQIIQGWTFGPLSPLRKPADRGLPSDRLEPDGRNLPLLLHRLRQDGAVWTRVRDALRDLYPRLDDVETSIDGQTLKLILREEDLPVPASRISDGTLRWLGLLALLLDPAPAPLICLEEPELGLHPDLISTLADLLKDASRRTQLVVTTHSDVLVSEFSPEDVVVCERQTGASVLRRLDPADLVPWLEEFSLGHAWRRGAFGGTRW